MTTTWTIDTPVSTTREVNPTLTKRRDYLLDHNFERITDDNDDDIIVFGDSGFEEVAGTTWFID